MATVGEILKFLAAVFLGLSVGVMLTGAVVLVPFWRASEPTDFLRWWGENARAMALLAGSLQLGSLLIASAAAVVSLMAGSPAGERVSTVGAALLAVAVMVPYLLYFQGANASFASSTIAVHDVPEELVRWAFWQWVRTGLGVTALVLSLLALRYSR